MQEEISVFASFLMNGTLLGKMCKSMLLQGFKAFFCQWIDCLKFDGHSFATKFTNIIINYFFSLICSGHYGITCLGINNDINNGINTGSKGPTRLV